MIVITGGAGFIGSNLNAALAMSGYEVVVVDWLGSDGKWQNLAAYPPAAIVPPDRLDDFLATAPSIEMIFHLGAISETTATDGDLVWRTNVDLSLKTMVLVRRSSGATGLRVVSGHVWRRNCGVR